MNKWILLLLFFLALTTITKAQAVLVQNEDIRSLIVVGQNPGKQALEAAAELQRFIYEMSHVKLPIVPAAEPENNLCKIYVGYNASEIPSQKTGLQIPSGITCQLNEEGYVVYADEQRIILAGNETGPYQGTYYAVYDFLESLGCRWYFPGKFGELIPKNRVIAVSEIKKVCRPEFRVRDIWYSGISLQNDKQQQEFSEWKRRNRLCRRDFWLNGTFPESVYGQNPVDDSTYKLLPREKYWDEYAEYYALNQDGSRNERFLCLSSEGAFRAAVRTVVDFFRENPEYYSFAFSPPDAPVLCFCDGCQNAMHGGYGGEGYGEVSDPWFGFVFKLAEEVQKVHPDKWIVTMAYYNRCRPPQGVNRKHNNVIIQSAPIQECSLHSYREGNCWSRQQFAQMLRHWSTLTNGIVYYEYDPHEWNQLQRPVWRSEGISDDFKFLKSMDGWGFSNEGQMAWASTGLNYYIRARLAWNVEENTKELIRDFCSRFFGPANREMFTYYTSVENAFKQSNVHLTDKNYLYIGYWGLYILEKEMNSLRTLLNEASGKAVDEPYKSRLKVFDCHFARMEAYLNSRHAAGKGDYHQAVAYAGQMAKAVHDADNTTMLQDFGRYANSLCSGEIVRQLSLIKQFTDASRGSLLKVLPENVLFRTDAEREGVIYHWYAKDIHLKNWAFIGLKTGWNSSEMVTLNKRPYEGIAWYRIDFDLNDRPVGNEFLFMPELKGQEIWLWCNGKFIKYSKIDHNSINEVENHEKSCRMTDLKDTLILQRHFSSRFLGG